MRLKLASSVTVRQAQCVEHLFHPAGEDDGVAVPVAGHTDLVERGRPDKSPQGRAIVVVGIQCAVARCDQHFVEAIPVDV
jgi:hypothetical protein